MTRAFAIVVFLGACGSVSESDPDAPPGGADAPGGADGGAADGAGDAGVGPDATLWMVMLESQAALDGYVRQDQTVASDVDYLNIGDRSDGQGVYGFVSFNTSDVPADAVLVAATLGVYQDTVTGTPYGTDNLGALRVQRVDYGGALDGSDFGLTADPGTSLVIASNANDAIGRTFTVDVVTIAGGCVGATRCQFRLRFARDTEEPASDGGFDYVTISSGEHATIGQRPTLHLTWEVP